MDLSPAASLRSRVTIALGRAARTAARLRGGGSGGTALPGLVVERTDPGFLARTLGQLPHGVIVVSGTNGKTTTTKMVVQLLRDQGLRVLTNRSGSNFVRGVLASLLTEVDAGGRLDADIAVLELDEAHAVRFVELVRPRAALLLNVMRDQLDRFGEIDYTASLLRQVAAATTGVVVVNADDPRLAADHFLTGLTARSASFGAGEELRSLFLSDDDLRTGHTGSRAPRPESCPAPRVLLESIEDQRAVVTVDGQAHTIDFAIPGIHNMLNACAALGLCLEVLGDRADLPRLLTTLSAVEAAFGRGEVLELDGRRIQLALVKNPAGFRMSLLSAATATADEVVMIAINDEYADGRDMSWLWDVDFTGLRDGVAVVTGVRAWDMALRLRYEEVPVGAVEPDLDAALELLRAAAAAADDGRGRPMRVFTTYTAMLALRARLGQITDVEEAMA
ncbi:MAG: MurT ligase domain-containing protein [Actinomyces sp.]|uniref:Mur ligase family protein n=1 Tax=Actinomyces sp. TaxID=29317 RepID=UPI0026DAE4E2|nr:Mur ligase family protein [Actinomyces sp.]MDO4243845.1 MurT ligase domain-containing protein [Actinomyces sp.]